MATHQNDRIRVLVNGAQGRMGQETVSAVHQDPKLLLVATCGHEDNLINAIKKNQAQVVVDFTTPSAVYENTLNILQAGAHPVIGTTGLLADQIHTLKQMADEKKIGGIIAPNFSIGAVLMMKFAAEAAEFLPHVEIIELHHDEKKDAPSGTAIKTAELIALKRKSVPSEKHLTELFSGSRGANINQVHVHSIRLPGFIAHQEVIFGGDSETLTIRHDSIHRAAFMPGVILACKNVMNLNHLVYGLDNLLWP